MGKDYFTGDCSGFDLRPALNLWTEYSGTIVIAIKENQNSRTLWYAQRQPYGPAQLLFCDQL
jgi:hypothetical protein